MRREHGRKMPSWLIGLLVLGLIAIGLVTAFSSLLGLGLKLPWTDTHEYKAVFASAQSIREGSPVRVAGVEVGKVTGIETLSSDDADEQQAQAGDAAPATTTDTVPEQAASVTMELQEDALPMRSDARFKIRPRLFLEGNYFVDLEPGSPNADEVEDGHTFPVNQTSNSVQLDTVLTTLQGDVRADLQVFLNQFGNALIKHGGAEGFRELYRTSPPSYKFTSQVNEAFLGTEPGDLGGLIKGLDKVVRGLGRDEQTLQDLVTNFRVFSGSFAAEDEALGAAIEELPDTLAAARPAFTNLNSAFPALRAFAREALPGVRSTPETLDAATPFIAQVRELVAKDELRGLVADLRPTIPRLAKLARTNIPFMKQARAVASCFNEVVIPWSNDTVEPLDATYPHEPAGRVFEETGYGLSGIASESRSGDANGQYIRVLGAGGTNTVKIPAYGGDQFGFPTDATVGLTPFDLLGATPRIEDSEKTKFKPGVPCETQEAPNLEAGTAPIPFDESSADAAPVDAEALLSELPPAQIEKAARSIGAPEDAAEDLGEVGGG